MTGRRSALLGIVTAGACGVTAALGVFGRNAAETTLVTSVRGERYEMVTSGLYAFNAQRVVAEGIGWDVFTLFAVVPALAIAAGWLLARQSFRARLVLLGLFGYVFYQYFMYALTWAFGPLLVPFIALALLGLGGILQTGSELAGYPLERCFDARFPRRGIAALAFALAGVLVAMWAGRIGAATRSGGEGVLLGQTTLVVQVLDLVIVVPFAVVTGYLTLRRRPLGYMLGAVFAVKAVAMAGAICAMLIVAARVEGSLEQAPFAMFAVAAALALGLAAAMLRASRGAEADAT